jgi:hypothetical protein
MSITTKRKTTTTMSRQLFEGLVVIILVGAGFVIGGGVNGMIGGIDVESRSGNNSGVHVEHNDCPSCCGLAEVVVTAAPTPTDVPNCEVGSPTPSTPWPTSTPELTPTATVVEPTPTVEPTDIPEPTPTVKPKCNRGLGNYEEGCDPGNSGGKPGEAGEEHEPHGPPGNQHGYNSLRRVI